MAIVTFSEYWHTPYRVEKFFAFAGFHAVDLPTQLQLHSFCSSPFPNQ